MVLACPSSLPSSLCPGEWGSGRLPKGKSAPDSLVGCGSLDLLSGKASPDNAVSLGKSLAKPSRLCNFSGSERISAAWVLPIHSVHDPQVWTGSERAVLGSEQKRAPPGPGADAEGSRSQNLPPP